jgi:RHS repeat-associated protein
LPGQYYDLETGRHYNYFRDYDPSIGRYIESDPIGLRGGLNIYGYAGSRPIVRFDRLGLYAGDSHSHMTKDALDGDKCLNVDDLAMRVQNVDAEHGTQRPENSHKHAMRNGTNGESADDAEKKYNNYVNSQLALCTIDGLAHALHAVQDSTAGGHSGFQPRSGGLPSASHFKDDLFRAANGNRCVLRCCQIHDNCYDKHRCNASSWYGNAIGLDRDCQRCNSAAVGCIVSAMSKGCPGCSQ